MGNKLAIMLVLVLVMIMAWGFMLDSDSIIVTVNGQRITGPMSGTIGIGGLAVLRHHHGGGAVSHLLACAPAPADRLAVYRL